MSSTRTLSRPGPHEQYTACRHDLATVTQTGHRDHRHIQRSSAVLPNDWSSENHNKSTSRQGHHPMSPNHENYNKYARTRQPRLSGKKSRNGSFRSGSQSPVKDSEHKDPTVIKRRQISSKNSPATTPVAPPATPVSSYCYESRPNSRAPLTTLNSDAAEEVEGRSEVDYVPERSESRQSKYHEDCTPRINPGSIIGSRARREGLYSAKGRGGSTSPRHRPSSLASNSSSFISRRESVVNVVYSANDTIHGDATESQLLRFPPASRRSGSVTSKLTPLPPVSNEVAHDEYEVVEEDDYRLSRCSFIHPSRSMLPDCGGYPVRSSSFLYQMVEFDDISSSVPMFVKHNIQRNGRLVSESFILRVNYLRRRRALGEMSNTANNANTSSKRAQKVSAPKEKTPTSTNASGDTPDQM